jgi:hypothetical protein
MAARVEIRREPDLRCTNRQGLLRGHSENSLRIRQWLLQKNRPTLAPYTALLATTTNLGGTPDELGLRCMQVTARVCNHFSDVGPVRRKTVSLNLQEKLPHKRTHAARRREIQQELRQNMS